MTRPPAGGPALTAAVIARDEAALLAGCLESLAWADARLVLVDARSRDATAAIAARYTPHVHREPFRSFPQFRNRALALATTPWVLFVDADERVPPALAAEIRAVLARAEAEGVAGYWLPRRNRIRGRWMRGAGWWPDYQLRLLRRDAVYFEPDGLVHEVACVHGPTRHLREPLLHHNYDTLAEFVAKQRRYAVLEAYAWWRQGQPPPRARALVGQPLREFWRRYVTLGGYRDGALGLVLAGYLAYAAWQRTRLLRRLASAGAAR
jgi:glycosyltransferase involved in cell wall biosynthesis